MASVWQWRGGRQVSGCPLVCRLGRLPKLNDPDPFNFDSQGQNAQHVPYLSALRMPTDTTVDLITRRCQLPAGLQRGDKAQARFQGRINLSKPAAGAAMDSFARLTRAD